MTDTRKISAAALNNLRWALTFTRTGIVAERLARAFWPVFTLALLAGSAFALGLPQRLSPDTLRGVLALLVLAGLILIVLGLRRFRWPSRAEALDRLDKSLPGRPISALGDALALGEDDPGSKHVWQAHITRMAARTTGAWPVLPDLRLAERDRFGLRYIATAIAVIALLFGSLARVAQMGDLAPGVMQAQAAGPSWEGWIEPPAYTGRPSLYLNKIDGNTLDVPEGSKFTLRLYGSKDAVGMTQSLSDPQPPATAEPEQPAAAVRALAFEAVRSGTLEITGAGGRSWKITVLPDTAPMVEITGAISREADGTMSQPFTAKDDYAVMRGRAEITLDTAALDRRYGLSAEPEPREMVVFDLPMPISGNRSAFSEALIENASKHAFANLPVKMAFFVEDGRAQMGQSETLSLTLPGRRFFDPLAAAIIEMRRDLLWTRQNGARTAQLLRALTHRPEGLFRNQRGYLMLRVAMRRLDAGLAQGLLSPTLRDELADALWEIAILVEDGGLADALERMQRAQERLSEAIRNGASPEEIQSLMDELRQATDEYIAMLGEREQADPADRFAEQKGQQITGDQIQEMMDEIQRLMEEGRMAEAQDLLEQLNRMMENLKVTQSPGGEGRQSPGQQAMRQLQDTLRDQQDLSDDAFRDLQEQFNPGGQQQQGQDGQSDQGEEGQQPGQDGQPQGQDGQQPGQDGQQPGQDGQNGQEGAGTGDQGGQMGPGRFADRQRALRDQLRQQRGGLPNGGGEAGDTARRLLDEAGRAMGEAEGALREGDTGRALDRQAEAIENLREGMRNLGQSLAQEQPGNPGQQGQQGEATGDAGREVPRDPLGRSIGQSGRVVGTGESLLQGDDVYRRARDLLDEIRKRSSDQTRPALELDYLKRLLDRF